MAEYEDGADLHDYIDDAISEFELAREWYWDHQDEPHLRFLADLSGAQMVAAALSLADPTTDSEYPEIPMETHLRASQSEKLRDEVAEAVQLGLVKEFHADLGSMAVRCYELTRHVFSTEPGLPAARFIARLTRCYVAGFHPECVILCRSVLENALRELFPLRGLQVPQDEHGDTTLSMMIKSAERFQLLTPDAIRDANLIRIRGNTAVHNDAEATRDVLGTIRLTTAVLGEIYGKLE